MDKSVVIIGSRVHGVGFRPFLLARARKLDLVRFEAENVFLEGKQAISVSFGGDERDVAEFLEFCKKSHPHDAEVSGVSETIAPIRVLSIDAYDKILAAEQQSTMVRTGLTMIGLQKQMMGTQDKMLGLQEKSMGTQDKMLGLQEKSMGTQDKMLGLQEKSMGTQDKMLGLQEKSMGTQDKMLGLQEKSMGTQDKMLGLQEKMLGMQEKTLGLQEKTIEKLEEFHEDNVKRFDQADARYEKIAQNLERILEEMKEERIEARKSTERIISMIAQMRPYGAVREENPSYGEAKKR
jgi:acylphosphatase